MTIEQKARALIKAMTDAGYTFDFEKKELKKVVVPIFNIGDTIIKKYNSDIRYFGGFTITEITDEQYWHEDMIICDIANQDEWEIYEPVRQTPAEWGEEDMFKVQRICKYLNEAKKYYADITEVRDCIDWLKSLKERYTWKPSKEQMNALDSTLQYSQLSHNSYEHLNSLYNDLKKLTE